MIYEILKDCLKNRKRIKIGHQIDYLKYASLVHKYGQKDTRAVNYKNVFIPNTIYKFQPLFGKDGKGLIDSKIRLDTLAAGQVYLSDLKNLNDPFDGNAIYWDKKSNEKYAKMIKNANINLRICSFTQNGPDCMPMWAYYANNHKGICVEYNVNVKDRNALFPVQYVEKRIKVDKAIAEAEENQYSNQNERKLAYQLHKCFLSNAIKHISWKSEKEIRLIEMKSKINLSPRTIYIGKECEYTDEIVEIARKLSCKVVMLKQADNFTNSFVLQM